MIQDIYGREITDQGDGVFSIEGLLLDTIGGTIEDALRTFNAMAPEDWVQPSEPLSEVGALATLLVVTGTLDIQDAANAVRLSPEDLIAEAEAWAIVQNNS